MPLPLLAPPTEPPHPEAERLFEEARRRERRRRVGYGAAVALVVVALAITAVTLFGRGDGRPGAAAGGSRQGAASAAVTRQALQFRPSAISVLHPVGRRCPTTDRRELPASSAGWVSWLGGCARVGPAVLSVRSVQSVTAGFSCGGAVLVSVQLRPQDVGRFDAMVRQVGARIIGSVILGRQLSVYTGDLNSPTAMAGDVQLVGGLSTTSRLPEEIAGALGTQLRWRAPQPQVGYC
jgi:hypothetical protein